ncbi:MULTISPECIES: hypothetical protein [Streptomyces]|uniref:hypothetical protein n=1 Tax=Streptomyces TaxID=1883 RepID=UPI00202AC027|nr:hypothetical protein [Streptomyces sp. CJ_13]
MGNFPAGAWICAHKAHVDYRVLSAHLPKWEPAGVLDTLRLAKATYQGLPSYGLDALTTQQQPDQTDAPAIAPPTTPTPPPSSCWPWLSTTTPGTSSSPQPSRPAGLAPAQEEEPTLW